MAVQIRPCRILPHHCIKELSMLRFLPHHTQLVTYFFALIISTLSIGSFAQQASLEIKTSIPVEVYDLFKYFGNVDGGYHPVSADGLTLVGSLPQGAFHWSQATGLKILGEPSLAIGSTAAGSLVIGQSKGTFFRWNVQNGVKLAPAVPAGFVLAEPKGIANDALVVVGNLHTTSSGSEPFVWDEVNGYRFPGRLFSNTASATDVSGNGEVVVGYGYNPDLQEEAFRWTQESGYTLLGDLPGHYYKSRALAISKDGSTIVGWTSMRETCGGLCGTNVLNRAFRWTLAGGMQDLGFVSGKTNNVAYSVSHDGSVILLRDMDYCIWREGKGLLPFTNYVANETSFDPTGWTLRPLNLVEINGKTVIVGVGRYAQSEPVFWHLVMDASQLPTVTIEPPSAGSSFNYLNTINLAGTANDPTDGDVSGLMVWKSSIDGVIGTGAAISTQLSVGVHIITAEVTSTGGTRSSAGITIDITNTAPVVSINTPLANTFQTGEIIALTATATDAEDGNLTASISWSSSLTGSLGQGGNLSAQLAEGSHTVIAKATDQRGASTTSSVQISVVNTAPIATNDAGSVNEGAAVLINLAANDSDSYEGINPASIVITSQPLRGSVAVNANGTVLYTHNGSESIADSFVYTIADAAGKTSNPATVSISINAVNDAPVANNDAVEIGIGQSKTFSVVANDVDAENSLNLQSIQILSNVSFGNLVVNPNGTVTYTHTGSVGQVDTFTYAIADSAGLASNSATVVITAKPLVTPVSYCASKANTSSYEWIAAINLAGQQQASGNNGGYIDATATVFNVQPGGSVPLALTPGYASSTYNEYWAAWIDFNKDGIFDTSERVYSSSGNSVSNGTISIPINALAGQTRMRVSMKYGGAPQPCETFSFGEVEDFTVSIQGALPYQLSSTSDYFITRSGTTADNVHWVVEENGVIVFSGPIANSLSYQYPTHQVNNQYKVWLRNPMDLKTVSNVVSYTFVNQQTPPTFCASSASNASYEWIDAVTFGGYINTSGKNSGYLNMTGAAAIQASSRTIAMTLKPGGAYTEYWAIWIDINRDGQLTSNERIYTYTGSSSISTTLNVPTAVTSGKYRMRVSMKYGGIPLPCESFTYGEVEDYLIQFNL